MVEGLVKNQARKFERSGRIDSAEEATDIVRSQAYSRRRGRGNIDDARNLVRLCFDHSIQVYRIVSVIRQRLLSTMPKLKFALLSKTVFMRVLLGYLGIMNSLLT